MGGLNNAGDQRIEDAHREAVAYAMKHIETDMQGRVRVGGADHDRVTGNLMAYRSPTGRPGSTRKTSVPIHICTITFLS